MEEGIQIVDSDEQFPNTEFSIPDSSESNAKVTVESDEHPEKQRPWRVSTGAGMQIDASDGQF
jgi:hypothetical protein